MEDAVGIFIFLIAVIFWLLILAISIGGFILWIVAIIDAAKRDFKQENDKMVWLLVILLAGWIGSLVYYFVVMRNPKKYTKNDKS